MCAASVCLNMIVKNESRVIRRCLDSVLRFIDTWVIVDTGSTDGTQDIIRSYFAEKDLPGELFEEPFRDFGYNRTRALELARHRADYTFIIDADEVLLCSEGFAFPELELDEYQIVHAPGESETRFYLTQLVRSALPWRYQGVMHEVILCDAPHRTGRIEGVVTKGFFDSARNVDPVAKYQRDAAVLEKALLTEPNNARYVFYLGQSYRDARDPERAVAAYRRRVAMGGWEEEQWHAQLQVALLEERLDHWNQAIVDYLAAYQLRPRRAEPLCELARTYRQRAQYHLAHLFASRALAIPRPDDILFVDESVYAWRALDEYSIAAAYIGEPDIAISSADRLLGEGKLPADQRRRVEGNREFFRKLSREKTRI